MQQTQISPRILSMRSWQRGFYVILGIFVAAIGFILAFAAKGQSKNGFLAAYALIPCAIGLYLIILAVRSRLIIDGDHIEVRGVFREQYAELNDIEGFRNISTRNGTYWRLYLKQGRGPITIQKWFNCDELRAWFQQLTDLDERDRNTLLDEIKQAQDLGSSPEDQLNALSQAKQLNIGLSVVAIAAAVVAYFSQGPIRFFAAVILALMPAIVLYLLNSDPLLYAMGKPKRDPRTDLTIAVLASGFGLLLSGISVHFVSHAVLAEWSALIAAVYIIAFFTFTQKGPRAQGSVLIIVIYGCLYAYGLMTMADTLLDQAPAITYAATVVGHHEYHGKSTTYYLELGPWGPFDRDNSLTVPHSFYLQTQVGQAVCLSLHPGSLHTPWYTRIDCGDRFVVGPTQ